MSTIDKWLNEDINRPPWRQAADAVCNLCGEPAEWLIKATGKTFPVDDQEASDEEAVRLPDWRVFACGDHLVELSDHGSVAAQSVAEAAPLRWSWAQWRWVVRQRLSTRARTVRFLVARPFAPLINKRDEMRRQRLVRRNPWMAELGKGEPSWRMLDGSEDNEEES